MQRNTRMVLILVDGRSSVADLCEKTGNQQLVESALQELERDGLVQQQLAHDSAWEQSRKTAEDIKAAAVSRLADAESLPPSPEPSPPAAAAPPLKPATSAEPFSIGPASIPSISVFPDVKSEAPLSAFGNEASAVGAPAAELPEMEPPELEPQAENPAGKRGGLTGVFGRDDDESIKPIRRGPRRYVSLPLAIALGVAGCVVLLALIFVLYPYDRHRPAFEAGLTRIVGEPVQVRSVSASLLPRPVLLLEGISVGDGERGRAARIVLRPQLFSLLGSHPVFTGVEVEAAAIDGSALAMLPKALAAAMQADAPAVVQTLAVNRLRLSLLDLTLPDLHGEFLPADVAAGKPLTLASSDRALRLQIRAVGTGVAADFEGYAWAPVADSAYRFDSVQGQAEWDGRSLLLRGIDARIFDGAVQGELRLSKAEKLQLAGDLRVKNMGLARLATALGYDKQFEGELAGALKFAASGAEWGAVLNAASGDGDFVLQRGVLGGMDLVEAVRRSGKGSVAGGSTRFEQLVGRFRVSPESIRFTDLQLSSGVLRSGGMLDVARDGKLSGRMDVEIRSSAAVVRTPVVASATLRSPVLQAGR